MNNENNKKSKKLTLNIDNDIYNCTCLTLKQIGIDFETYVSITLKKLCEESKIPFSVASNPDFWIGEDQINIAMEYIDSGKFIETNGFFNSLQLKLFNFNAKGRSSNAYVGILSDSWCKNRNLAGLYELLLLSKKLITDDAAQKVFDLTLQNLVQNCSEYAKKSNIKWDTKDVGASLQNIDNNIYIPIKIYHLYKTQFQLRLAENKFQKEIAALNDWSEWLIEKNDNEKQYKKTEADKAIQEAKSTANELEAIEVKNQFYDKQIEQLKQRTKKLIDEVE